MVIITTADGLISIPALSTGITPVRQNMGQEILNLSSLTKLKFSMRCLALSSLNERIDR